MVRKNLSTLWLDRVKILIMVVLMGGNISIGLANQKGDNLLKNGGFEEITKEGVPLFWEVEGEKGCVMTDKEVFHSGKASLKIKADSKKVGVYQFIPYEEDKEKLYKLTVWLKTDLVDTTKLHIHVAYYSKEGEWLGEEDCGRWNKKEYCLPQGFIMKGGKTGWKKYIWYFGRYEDVPKGTGKIKVSAICNLWNTPEAKGYAWVDDFVVEQVDRNPLYKPGFPPVKYISKKIPKFSKEAKDDGYIVYPVNTLSFIVPDRPPEVSNDVLKISAFTYPSDILPLTFCIHAFKDIKDVKIDIKGLDFPKENIRIGKVFYLYRRCYRDLNEYMLSPGPIEEFDSCSIDKDKTQQFWINIKIPDAPSSKYECEILITPSNAKEKRIKVAIDVFPIRLMEPEEVYFGFYDSIFARDNKETVLKRYKDMKGYGLTAIGYGGNFGSEVVKDEDGKIKIKWNYEKGLALALNTYRDVGFNLPFHWLTVGEIERWAKKFGGEYGSPSFNEVYKEIVRQIKEECKKNNWPEIVFTPVSYGYPYEFKDAIMRGKVLPLLKEVGARTASDGLTMPTIETREYLKKYYPLIDYLFLTFMHPPVTISEKFLNYNSWKEFKEKVRKDGKKIVLYNIGVNGDRYAEMMRFGYGIATWLKEADGLINWAYLWGFKGYDEISMGGYDAFYYPPEGEHKGGPTIGLEATREGIEDYKLLYTLKKLIESAEDGTDQNKKRIAREAQKEIEKILSKVNFLTLNSNGLVSQGGFEEDGCSKDDVRYVSGEYKLKNGLKLNDYDKLRLTLCQYIMKLSSPTASGGHNKKKVVK